MKYQQKQVSRSVFRAYDIRGIIGKELDENAFYSIGLALACHLSDLKRQQIFLARDGRLTSFAMAAALKQGLLDSGIDVLISVPSLHRLCIMQFIHRALIAD